MKLVYTHENYIDNDLIKSLLETNNIECFVKNKALSGAAGLLPTNEIWPEVWIHDDQDENKSLKIIKSFLSQQQDSPNWTCECGEKIEGQFTECWNCGYAFEQ